MDLAAFNEYEREFLSLTSQLPTRISTILQYTTDAEQANAEIKRIDSDLIQAKQRVRRDATVVPRARVRRSNARRFRTLRNQPPACVAHAARRS